MIRDLGMPRLWRCEIINEVMHAVDETGNVTLEMHVPGALIDYIGPGCIVRANIAAGQFVIHEKVMVI